jgi:hypothetical protein
MRRIKHKRSTSLWLHATITAVLAPSINPASAQELEEIVVTAVRYEDRYESFTVPHVSLKKRADFVVEDLFVESDTRELDTRRNELMQTLNDLGRRAAAGGPVTIAILEESEDEGGDTRVKPFSVSVAEEAIRSGSRPDTSRVELLIRTAVSADDTIESVEERFDSFVRGLPKPGRVSLSTGDAQLTLVSPAQYREEVIAAIGQDARAILGALGPGQAVELEGLENQLAWRRTGDLELTVFLPHRLKVVPAGR